MARTVIVSQEPKSEVKAERELAEEGTGARVPPAGGGGDRLPPEEGWQAVAGDGSRDGKESGRDEPNMRVTGFNLAEATADEMYQRGGELTADGILCKVKDLNSFFKSEEWRHIRWSDEQMCDGTKNCENGMDELELGCHQQVVVATSEGRDGIFIYRNGRYKQEDGHSIIFKQGNRWVIAEGSNRREAVVIYKSKESKELPREGWTEIVKKGGRFVEDPVPRLQVVKVPQDFDGNQVETDEGLICKSGHKDVWHFLTEGDKKRCNGVCECGTCRDEEDCEFHSEFKDTGFLVVRGVEPQQNGVYQLVKDFNDNPQFFRHMDTEEKLIIYRKDGGWALSRGDSPETVTKVLYTSPSWTFGVSDPVWKKGENVIDIMRVTSVSTVFNETQMLEGDWEEDEGIICQGDNNQRLFIEKTGADPFYCDRRNQCLKTGMDERSCSILVDLTFEQPIFSAFGAVGVGILLFFVFRKSLKGRGERKRHRKVGRRLRRSIDQIVDQARMLGKEEKEGLP